MYFLIKKKKLLVNKQKINYQNIKLYNFINFTIKYLLLII